MQVVLTVKNSHKVMNPTKDDIILYDGKIWYVTTKEEILKEWKKLLQKADEKIETLEVKNEELRQDNQNFRKEVAKQLKDMSDLIEKLFTNKESNNL